jgi:hypothetical protein
MIWAESGAFGPYFLIYSILFLLGQFVMLWRRSIPEGVRAWRCMLGLALLQLVYNFLPANVNRGVLISLLAMALSLIACFVFFWVTEGSRDLRSPDKRQLAQ